MINIQNIEDMKWETRTGHSKKFNCWGATQFALGMRKKFAWVSEQVMLKWIDKNTTPVTDEVTPGDILILKSSLGTLFHTAVYLGNNNWFHKLGSCETTFSEKEEIIKGYFKDPSSAQILIHRLKKTNKVQQLAA